VDLLPVIISIINTVGLIYVALIQRRQTPAQKDKDVIANYSDLLNQYRIRSVEQEKEINRLEEEKKADEEAHLISIRNFEAVMKKREIDHSEEVAHINKDLRDYQVGYAALRRVAARYVPPDVMLPEVNGKTKDLN
jgi:hypothetical protein